MLVEELTYNSK